MAGLLSLNALDLEMDDLVVLDQETSHFLMIISIMEIPSNIVYVIISMVTQSTTNNLSTNLSNVDLRSIDLHIPLP